MEFRSYFTPRRLNFLFALAMNLQVKKSRYWMLIKRLISPKVNPEGLIKSRPSIWILKVCSVHICGCMSLHTHTHRGIFHKRDDIATIRLPEEHGYASLFLLFISLQIFTLSVTFLRHYFSAPGPVCVAVPAFVYCSWGVGLF